MYKTFKAKVIRGKNLGNKIGFRTANLKVKLDNLLDGVYKINGVIAGVIYKGAGVYFKEKNLFEAHFLNFNKDIYGKIIEIVILSKIRENKFFKTSLSLKKQIEQDIKYVETQNDYVLTFGTFDILHPGHKYYLKNAKKLGDVLVTIVANDLNVEKFKGKVPINNIDERIKNLKKLSLSDIICSGEKNNTLIWIELYNPKIICLGYDQIGFIKDLEKYIENKKLNIEIIRIPSYKPEIYKSSLLKANL